MAILDNYEVTILTICPNGQNLDDGLETIWNEVKEYHPPGSERQKSTYNTCRRYIGIPPIKHLGSHDRFSTEFVIDYKVKCGFAFPDQDDVGAEYLVFRTQLDGEKIGSASVKRERWERSGTYRVRKQGKRYMLEDGQNCIRQRWALDPGLHGTIKVEVWREQAKVATVNEWGFIDLTGFDEPVMNSGDLYATMHERNVKRPRVKHLTKVDLVPLATFEFEYRSEETLCSLGLTNANEETNSTQVQQGSDTSLRGGDNNLWQTTTNTSSSGDTIDSTLDTFSTDMDQTDRGYNPYIDLSPTDLDLDPLSLHTDAIGRSLLTGARISMGIQIPSQYQMDTDVKSPRKREREDSIDDIGNIPGQVETASEQAGARKKPQRQQSSNFIDLTSFD